MNLVDFAARGLFYRTEDDRIVFRPWGPRGPCYLLTERQRTVRARFQLGFYGVMLAGVVCASGLGMAYLVACLGMAMGINYLMFWFFSMGLPRTAIPHQPSPAHREAELRALGQSLGKPVLWLLTIVCGLSAVVGVLSALLLGEWGAALLCALFLGTCTVLFARMLRRLSAA